MNLYGEQKKSSHDIKHDNRSNDADFMEIDHFYTNSKGNEPFC